MPAPANSRLARIRYLRGYRVDEIAAANNISLSAVFSEQFVIRPVTRAAQRVHLYPDACSVLAAIDSQFDTRTGTSSDVRACPGWRICPWTNDDRTDGCSPEHSGRYRLPFSVGIEIARSDGELRLGDAWHGACRYPTIT